MTAVDTWMQKVPSLTFNATIGNCPDQKEYSGEPTKSGIICIHPTTFGDGLGHSGLLGQTVSLVGGSRRGDTGGVNGVDGGDIFLDIPLIQTAQGKLPNQDVFLLTVMHELGHAQGLVHHSLGYNLMNPDVNDKQSGITCDDVNQWYYVRFETAPTCSGE
jgi:hypothetical protein